ncbi:uncharacterized protein G2W53_018426 [Senna tora]|uniref:Uncharacterized protein n=1 Tax=Senna tora TaxID=362788 RepID=A0A834TTN4_9FABA|nr:uncharacterized protein G2W53_018426 [Senna tora]
MEFKIVMMIEKDFKLNGRSPFKKALSK